MRWMLFCGVSDSDSEGRLADAAEKATGRRRKLTALWIFLVLATVSFWPAYHQNGSGLNLWAVKHTDRIVWGHEIQAPMFSLVNSLVCIFCGGLIVRAMGWLWDRTGRGGQSSIARYRRTARRMAGQLGVADGVSSACHFVLDGGCCCG